MFPQTLQGWEAAAVGLGIVCVVLIIFLVATKGYWD